MVVALATLFTQYDSLIVQRSDNMGITYTYEIGEKSGKLKVDLCNQGAQFQSQILKFLGSISKDSIMKIDQMDMDGTCRFRLRKVHKRYLNRIEKFTAKLMDLSNKDE